MLVEVIQSRIVSRRDFALGCSVARTRYVWGTYCVQSGGQDDDVGDDQIRSVRTTTNYGERVEWVGR